MKLKNWFVPSPPMGCLVCGSRALMCRRWHDVPGKIEVVCQDCVFTKLVDDHRA